MDDVLKRIKESNYYTIGLTEEGNMTSIELGYISYYSQQEKKMMIIPCWVCDFDITKKMVTGDKEYNESAKVMVIDARYGAGEILMKALRICWQNVRKWGGNRRIWMLIILSILSVHLYTRGLWDICSYVGEPMSPWIFPFLFIFRYMKIEFMIPLVFIFCDAPFVDSNQMYVMLRTDRTTWGIGQVLYIFAGSFFYMFVLMMSTIVLNIGHIKWDNTWGNVLGLAGTSTVQTVLGHATDTVKVLGIVIKYFTPVQAMFFSALLMWLSFVLTGLIIYVFNIITGTKFIGVCVASFFIIFTAVADGKSMITRVSPMSWNSLNNIDIGGMTQYSGIVYVLTLYIVMIVILSVIAVAAGRKTSINSSDEV